MIKLIKLSLCLLAINAFGVAAANAAETAADVFNITIKNHKFTPEEITVPAGKKIQLIVDNQDATPEEFESKALHREKVIPGNSKGTIVIGPLQPGDYAFVGEFNENTAKGVIKVK